MDILVVDKFHDLQQVNFGRFRSISYTEEICPGLVSYLWTQGEGHYVTSVVNVHYYDLGVILHHINIHGCGMPNILG